MANKNQHFGELEYCFNQYFSKYCAPVISKDYNYYRRKQLEEFNKAYNNAIPSYYGAGSLVQPMLRVQATNIAAQSSGKWSKKNLDDFINGVVNKIISNKNFIRDWENLVSRYRESLIAKLGTKGYIKAAETLGKTEGKKFIDPADYYGQMRFMDLVKNHLARTNMPKSSMDYILKEAANSSIMMTLGQRFIRARSLSPAEEEIYELGNKMYKPSKTEKVSAFILGAAVDAPGIDGVGSLAAVPLKGAAQKTSSLLLKKGAVKWGSWLGDKAAYKVATKASYVKGLTSSAAIDAGFNYWASSKVNIDASKKAYSKTVFGNEQTLQKYQKGALGYRKNGTEYISNINDGLGKKIKVGPMRPHVSNSVTNKESNQLLVDARGNSRKLLKSIATALSRQALPYKDQASIPAWMLQKTSKQCRAYASTFLSMAKQMSAQSLHIYNINGKNMTLAQVTQRAGDYAKAAVLIDQINAEKQVAKTAAYNRKHTGQSHTTTRSSSTEQSFKQPNVGRTRPSTEQINTPPAQNMSTGAPQGTNVPSQQNPQNSNTAGWGNYLDNAGLNGFSDVSKNLGYVLAMLPDMLIGMFTGKTSSFTIDNNIIPLAAIAAGLFSRNPLLKLMFMGFGGMNLLNNAGHELLGVPNPKEPSKNYKQYADEPLNPRLSNVVLKGRTLIADIDNNPVVINISDTAIDAYEKKVLPLNTLANAVLKKYDENRATASNSYDRNLASEQGQEQLRGYGLK